jgi:serine/threonine-protein kinase
LSSLGGVFDKALAKSRDDRYPRCIDFARALSSRTGVPAATAGPRHAKAEAATRSRRKAVIGGAVALAVLAAAAVAFIVFDRHRDPPPVSMSSPPSAPLPPPAPPGGVTLPVVAVGANCATLGSAGITAAGGPAYCAHLPTTDAAVWSLYPGEISSPTVTPGPDEEVYAPETESPVLVCMEQTGQSRLDCHDDILQSNTGGQPAPTYASGAS